MKNIVESNTNLKAQISFSKTQLQLCNHDYMNLKKNILEGGRQKLNFNSNYIQQKVKTIPTVTSGNPCFKMPMVAFLAEDDYEMNTI